MDLSRTTKNIDFGLITPQKELLHFNTLFGRRDCSLIVQEAISLQSSRMKVNMDQNPTVWRQPKNIIQIGEFIMM